MSKLEVDTIAPQSGTQVTLGESGDTITIPAGATFDASSGTLTLADGSVTNAKLAGSITNDKLTNSSITINGSSVSLGGSTTIETGTSWQSDIKTSAFTAVAGEGYWINTTSAAITVTLPASASVGDTIEFSDYARTWGTNAVTLNLNSLNFQGGTKNPVYDTNGESVKIIYSGTTKGWIPSNDGTVADEGNFYPYNIDFLVIAGGGYGRFSSPGGGGAGGYRNSYSSETSGRGSSSETSITASEITYTITVGAGGTGSSGTGQGSDSSISGSGFTTITSIGGGFGGSGSQAGGSGGSGGGAGEFNASGDGAGTANQGYDGGSGNGGGGGAGGAGYDGYGLGQGLPNGGLGGAGLASSITGSSVTRASGGSGYYAAPSPTRSANVTGGGGGASQVNGVANTGGGGAADGGNGGSGVVILRMATVNYSGTTTGSPTVTTSGSDTILIFTGSGSYTA